MRSGNAARTLYFRTSNWTGAAPMAAVLSAGAGQIALFVSGVAVARILGPTDRGTLATVALVVAIGVSIASLGVPLALTYGLAKRASSARSLARWGSRMFVPQALLLVPLSGLGIGLLARRDDVLPTIVLGAAATAFVLAQIYGLAILQGRLRFARLNLVRVAPAGLYAVFALLLLTSGTGDLTSVTAAFLLANVIAALVICLPTLSIPGADEPVNARPLIRFGVRAWLGSISPLDTFRFDQIVVVLLFSQAVVGTYVVALAFSNLPRLIGVSVGSIAFPRIAAIEAPDARRKSIFGYTLGTMLFAAPLVAIIAIAAMPIIQLFFGVAYASAAQLVGPLVAAGWLAGGRRTMSEAARGGGYALAGSAAEVSAWIGFAVAAILTVPTLHERGVAVAMLVGAATGLAALICLVLMPSRQAQEEVVIDDSGT